MSLDGSSAMRRAPASRLRSFSTKVNRFANEGVLEAKVRTQSFNRRSFLGKLAGTAGAAALVAAATGCQGVQQALGPKPSSPAAPAGGTPSTSAAAAPAKGAALAPATIRYMGHFTGLGDTGLSRRKWGPWQG